MNSTPTKQEAEARICAALPPRVAESHKGSYGNALLFCGSRAYTGAASLAAMGAARAGAGITHLAAPEEALLPVRIRLPEVVCHPIAGLTEEPASLSTADKTVGARGAILIGCGIGQGDGSATAAFCEALAALLAAPGVPVVLDADALNMLSGARCAISTPRHGDRPTPAPPSGGDRPAPSCASGGYSSPAPLSGAPGAAQQALPLMPCAVQEILSAARRPVVLTPHPAEFARLCGLSTEEVQADRVAHATAFARATGAILLLKGNKTVLALPDGSYTVNPSGSAALAKGGTGDVLAGVLVGLLAGGMAPAEAAFAAAYLHGAAGETLAAQVSPYGVLPSELPAAIAREIARLLSVRA